MALKQLGDVATSVEHEGIGREGSKGSNSWAHGAALSQFVSQQQQLHPRLQRVHVLGVFGTCCVCMRRSFGVCVMHCPGVAHL